ncbi:MAG TPA: aminotransferase class V-fold PLP-dependent enzyme [Aromatoleum sp.]|uniref:aminotransferase class V-fold PLP-dependent enzyme n=1 Tax=Aromatoleum sp. TaxID=2307007 RepID=UPI002B470BC8|nr:aminotransferase class V-fold PLP-dependent enzyme [Aromatoleum sp.]HJV27830.1 aminotransferase class V-fold PLP-dependent enzyme [Aromatoleum sp.]
MTSRTTETVPVALRRDLAQARADFPILRTRVNGQPLTYLDNAATTQKPDAVIDAEADFYRTANANVHRGVHALSQRATDAHEGARHKVRSFINARADAEVIFVRGTTEAINLVAQGFAEPRLAAGDEVIVSAMEHHSNIVPWQMACRRTMIRSVSFDTTEYNELPYRLEAGTPHIAGVVGLGAALDYVSAIGIERIAAHERALLQNATRQLAGASSAPPRKRPASCPSRSTASIRTTSARCLDDCGIAVRAGHHCAMPLMQRLGLTGTARASFALYNTHDDVERLVTGIRQALSLLVSSR